MSNKKRIEKLREMAELAWVAYGYFHLLGKKFKDRKDDTDKPLSIALTDILDITYKGYEVKDTGWFFDDKLDGDMSPKQAQRFFERYELIEYYPKDNSKGFHACLFKKKTTKQYTLAIRGSYDTKDYLEADFWNLLTKGQVPKSYYENMLRFYNKCVEKYSNITKPESLNVVGHSL